MDAALTVGALAREVGVTPKTIRYYEAIGLLPPAARAPNGYRRYRPADTHRLAFIQRAKVLGLALDEIRDLVGVAEGGQCTLTKAELRQILNLKIMDCTQRIDELVAFRTTLEAAAQQLPEPDQLSDHDCCPSCAAFAPSCTCVPDVQDIHLTLP